MGCLPTLQWLNQPPLLKETVDKSLLNEQWVTVSSSAAQPGLTCSRSDPPPQLLLFGSVLECASPDWALSQEHRDPRVRMWLDLFPPYWTM